MTEPRDASPLPDLAELDPERLRKAVRDRYATEARRAAGALGAADDPPASAASPAAACCGPRTVRHRGDSLATAPPGAGPMTRDLYDVSAAQTSAGALAASLGCGNPTALADLAPGQTVLDLGSGGGLDVLLSAKRVGPEGKAYGVDMTAEMLALARRNQAGASVANAEFLEGTIEDVPLPDGSVDVVISNCVINLAADKDAVLREAFRLLASGGRFAVSDIVILRPLPEPATRVARLWTGCVAGALLATEYVAKLNAAGFVDADVQVTRTYTRQDLLDLASGLLPEDLAAGLDVNAIAAAMDGAIASAFIRAVKA